MTVGERIKELRKEMGMSADELGEKLGKNRATIYRYESEAIRSMPLEILEPISKALNVSPGYLMGWTDDRTMPTEPEITLNAEEKEMILKYRTLNDEGKYKIRDYIGDLYDSGKYKKFAAAGLGVKDA